MRTLLVWTAAAFLAIVPGATAARAARSISQASAGVTHPFSPSTDEYRTGGVITHEAGDTILSLTITKGGADLATSWSLTTLTDTSKSYLALSYPAHQGGSITVTTKAVIRDSGSNDHLVESGRTVVTH